MIKYLLHSMLRNLKITFCLLILKYIIFSIKKCMNNDISDFSVLKFFVINTRPMKILQPIWVVWSFSQVYWIKVNKDGFAKGYPRV